LYGQNVVNTDVYISNLGKLTFSNTSLKSGSRISYYNGVFTVQPGIYKVELTAPIDNFSKFGTLVLNPDAVVRVRPLNNANNGNFVSSYIFYYTNVSTSRTSNSMSCTFAFNTVTTGVTSFYFGVNVGPDSAFDVGFENATVFIQALA